MEKGTAPEKGFSPSARGRGATSICSPQRQASAACQARRRRIVGARGFGVGCAARKLSARASRAALVVMNSYTVEGRRMGERPPSFGTRPWCDVHLQPSTPSQRRVSNAAQAHRRCSWFLGWMRSTQAFCTRAPRCAGCDQFIHRRRSPHRKKTSLLRRAPVVPWHDVPTAASDAKPPSQRCVSRGAGTLMLAISGEEANPSTMRLAVLDVVGLYPTKWR